MDFFFKPLPGAFIERNGEVNYNTAPAVEQQLLPLAQHGV